MAMTQTTWKLKEFMDMHRVRPGELARATEGKLSRAGIYGLLTDERPQSVHFATLDALIPALSGILGERVEITDLIDYGGLPTETNTKRGAWRRLIGAIHDPDGPTDIAERHDDYLSDIEAQEYDQATFRGER